MAMSPSAQVFDAPQSGCASQFHHSIISLTEKSNIAMILMQYESQFATMGLIKLSKTGGGED
jgi:hypothetical protein